MSDIARVIVLVLLAAVTLKLGRARDSLKEAVTFGLASLAVLLVSPLAWGHYFVFALPAALFEPLWLRRQGRPLAANLAAAGLPLLTCSHYLLKPWCGPIGLLGLGTALWFAAASAVSLLSIPTAPGPQSTKSSARGPHFARPARNRQIGVR